MKCDLPIGVALLLLSVCAPAQAGAQDAPPQAAGAAQADSPASPADLSGVWMIRFGRGDRTRAPMTPWAAELMKSREAAEDPGARCLPPGVPRDMGAPYPVEILQTPTVVYILHEYMHLVRRVFVGGRHPEEVEPTFMGHSIGRWEGKTLIVDTIGLNDRTWLGPTGQPHSEQLHVIERITRAADGTSIEVETTIDDPKAYTSTWTMKNTYARSADQTVMEYICQENNRAVKKQEG